MKNKIRSAKSYVMSNKLRCAGYTLQVIVLASLLDDLRQDLTNN